VIDDGVQPQLVLSTTCFYRGKPAGELLVWLSWETLFSHFVDLVEFSSLCSSGLVDENGRLHRRPNCSDSNFAEVLSPERIRQLPKIGFSLSPFVSDGDWHEMQVACLPIHSVGLSYMAWVPTDQIAGGLTPGQLILGIATLTVCLLAGFGGVLWFSAQNLILKTRFEETERQHGVLTAKNRQLKEEIQKREDAEKELAAQRTLRMRSDRLRSLGEMAAGIAHELNQPLVGVRGFAELMLDSLDDGMGLAEKDIQHHAAKIVQQADRMVHIINHVRLFARDAGNVETAIVDLNDVVRSGTSLLKAQFNSHGLALEITTAQYPIPVKINAFSVEEVIINLLSNARHAVEQKREVAGAAYQPLVRIGTRTVNRPRGKPEGRLVVADNGRGIPEETLDRIFDPFFTTKDPDKGTGLGLSISKSIVESFQGRIDVLTNENGETRFEIAFPTYTE
jgi:C4-dicarboxylate-specific signal transduction histidine kinase